jgi:hypothetical protein
VREEGKAIGVLLAACTAELDRQSSRRPVGATFDDRHALLHGIARELESLADVLNIEQRARRKPARSGLVRTYRRVLELPLARTIRSVLSSQLARLERAHKPPALLDAA